MQINKSVNYYKQCKAFTPRLIDKLNGKCTILFRKLAVLLSSLQTLDMQQKMVQKVKLHF